MKPLSDDTIEQFEEVALEGLKKLREFFKYEGDNPRYLQRAKVAATAVAAYTRIRASESNRMAVELMASRASGEINSEVKMLATGPKRIRG